MKISNIGFGFIAVLLVSLLVPSAEAVTIWGRSGVSSYATSGSSYWNYVQNYYAEKNNTSTSPRSTSNNYWQRARYTRRSTPTSSYQRQLTPNYASSVTPRRTFTPTYLYNRNRSSSASTYTGSGVQASVTPISQRQPKQTIDNGTIDVFEVGVSNNGSSRSSYSEAVMLDSMTFQMYARSGIAHDPQDFEIVVNDQGFNFEPNGSVTLSFTKGNRIARGESFSFRVQVRIDDPSSVSSQPGAFRLRLVKATTRGEISQSTQSAFISGQAFSDVIAYDPILTGPIGGGTGVFTAVPATSLFGSNLQAGQEATVLALNLQASKDDLILKEISVRDTVPNSAVDVLIDELKAVDANTGEILASTRFVNGRALLDFGSGIFIGRNDNRKIAFVADIVNNIPQSGTSSFELDIDGGDVYVVSNSTGKTVLVTNSNISLTSNTYTVVGSDVSVSVNNQPSTLITTGTPNQIFRFQINNPSSKTISLGKVSFLIFTSGVEYPGGISTDDFELKVLNNNGSELNANLFTPVSASGNNVSFEATNGEFSIGGGQTMQFGLKAALNNIGSSNSDSVTVRVLDDTAAAKGTLASLKPTNNFVWSDHSGRPHTSTSSDWLNGYQLRGLPTNAVVVSR